MQLVSIFYEDLWYFVCFCCHEVIDEIIDGSGASYYEPTLIIGFNQADTVRVMTSMSVFGLYSSV